MATGVRLGPSDDDGEAPLRVGLSGLEAESSQEPVVRFAALWGNFNEGAAICAAARAREGALGGNVTPKKTVH